MLSENDIKNNTSYYNQSIGLMLTYLYFNEKYYSTKIIKTRGGVRFKNIFSESWDNICEDLTKYFTTSKVSLNSLFDLILLSTLKQVESKRNMIDSIDGVTLIIHEKSEVKELAYQNICSDIRKMALLYNKISEKWDFHNLMPPKLKIGIIKKNYNPKINLYCNGKVQIIEGSGEKNFKVLIKNKSFNLINLSYEELIEELIRVLNSEKYQF